jgi:adhesin/invasin
VYGAPLQVTVTDAVGNPASGVPVLFTAPASGPGGSFGGQLTTTVNTDAQGRASVIITANGIAGTFGVSVSCSSIAGDALFYLTNLPSGAGSLVFVQQPGDTPSGKIIAPAVAVQVRNAAGNPVQVPGIPVLLTISSGTGSLGGTVVQLTDGNGLATFNDLQISAAGRKTLRATSSQQSPVDSIPFQITAGAAAAIKSVSGSPQFAGVLQPFASPLRALVTDAAGNPVSGAPVLFTAPAAGPGAGGTFGGDTTVVTDANGLATSPTLTANGQPGSFVVTANAPGVSAPAVFVLVNLPQQSGAVVVDPTTLTFTSEVNQPAPPAQTVQLTAASNVSWTIISSATWLTVSPSAGTGSAQITVSVDPSGLATGTYTGLIGITDSTGALVVIPVTYVIAEKPVLAAKPFLLIFAALTNTATPPAQTLQTSSNSRIVPYGVTVQVDAASGGNWLRVSQPQGQTAGTVTVSVNPANLGQGVYNGSIRLTPTDGTTDPVTVPVTLIVGCLQGGCTVQPTIIAVVNAASFHPVGSPGAAMTIFGTNLSDDTHLAATFPLPKRLGPTSVSVNGIPAPLYYASPTQINFQMPAGVPATGVTVAVQNDSLTGLRALSASPARTEPLVAVDPALFVNDGGRAAALNGDLSVHTAATPIPAGGTVVLFLTGQGPVTPPIADGAPAPSSPLSTIDGATQVTIGGTPAQILFKGLAPGWVGVAQVNVVVPNGLTPGDQPVVVTINGSASNTGLITVQ